MENIGETFKYQFFGGRIPKNERKENLFYYELRDAFEDGYSIERNVWVNHIGSLITSKDILGSNEFIMYEDFVKLNGEESLDLYEEEIEENKESENKIINEHNFCKYRQKLVSNFRNVVKSSLLATIERSYYYLLESNKFTEEMLDDMAYEIINDDQLNNLFDELIIDAIENFMKEYEFKEEEEL